MAPTTIIGQKTTTTPWGRNPEKKEGYPLRITEILAGLKGVAYAERTCLATPQDIIKTKRAIMNAFSVQHQAKGFAIVEVLSQCPTIWRMAPLVATQWVQEEMTKFFPLGRIK